MKILFFVHKANRIRHFQKAIESLMENGHEVHLAFKKVMVPANDYFKESMASGVRCVYRRQDEWGWYVGFLRSVGDYLRYWTPSHWNATALRARALGKTDDLVRWLLDNWIVRLNAVWLGWFLRKLEDALPSAPSVESFLLAQKPDVILITPLVNFNTSYQVEYIKSAHKLRIPVAFLPYSWDNLTNKGLMRAVPDRVFVWNETQKREAVALHRVPPERIVVCGAWRFDEFIAMKPQTTREEFCRQVRLKPTVPFVVYLASSHFAAPNEIDFVQHWIKELRASEDPLLQTCGVLIKPYPSFQKPWKRADFSKLPNVSVLTSDRYYEGPQRSRESWGDQALYDTLFHSSAVFGLNTSAMIEAAILSKPVYSMLVKEFDGGQDRTLHFHYLRTVNGGLLHLATNFAELRQSLSKLLSAPTNGRDVKSDRFAEAFVRPHGLSTPTIPIVVSEIENLAALEKGELPPPAWWHKPLLTCTFYGLECVLIPFIHFSKTVSAKVSAQFRSVPEDKSIDTLTSRFKKKAKGILSQVIVTFKGDRLLARVGYLPVLSASRESSSSTPSSHVARLDYEPAEILIHVTSKIEQKWRVRSCRKEPWTVKWLEDHVSQGHGEVLYDIGANVGTFSLVAAKLMNGHENSKVVAFEPGYASFARLCDNIVLNKCTHRIIPIPLPLSQSTGMAYFQYRSLDPGQSRHEFRPEGDAMVQNGKRYTQPMLAFNLDELAEKFNLPKPTHIKLDVDGEELAVLQGASAILAYEGLRTVLVEVDHKLSEPVIALLKSKGLKLKERYQELRPTGEPKPWYGLFARD
jgi:FkbM family methyltransferase